MNFKTKSRAMTILVTVALLFSLFSTTAGAASNVAPSVPVTFTILHTNDFHGQLDSSLSASNPGSARIATIIKGVRDSVGTANVLLADVGDEMQGSLLSNLGDGTAAGKGIPTIAAYNAMGYNVATFGNHEFDWGQDILGKRTTQALYPYVTANIVQNDTGNCATAGWTKPAFADNPFEVLAVGSPTPVKVAFIGVTSTETPIITISTASSGLCFKDPAESIIHYYADMKAAGADVIVVLSHLGLEDGGYGYGIPAYGDKTLAARLNTAGKPVNLILGGHSHTNMSAAVTVGTTTIAQAYYNGRNVGRADVTVGTNGSVGVVWSRITGFASGVKDPTIDTLVSTYANDPTYLGIVNTPVGYSAVDLSRSGGAIDNMMGSFIDDAIYNSLNNDTEPANDIDVFFNNSGGIRTDWCYDSVNNKWNGTGCVAGIHTPALLNYGHMFTVLPFGNATVVGKMTGAQILELINASPIAISYIQPAGLRYKYYKYVDANPGPQPYAWGGFDVTIRNKATGVYEALDMNKTYSVGTNEFMAPSGGDGYTPFKYMTSVTYWGDMLNAVNSYVSTHYTLADPYRGPNNDGMLDGRFMRDGNDAGGSIIPLTILHHNDSHGNLVQGTFVGYTQLATLIKQERAHNPNRTLLLNGGDAVQGDAMMYYFKSAPSGYAADGTPLDPSLKTHPMMAVLNSMKYDAFVLGNHEFNFGSDVFKGIFGQAQFPILGANVADDGRYGLASANGGQGAKPFVEKTLDGIKVAILGITNHRVPNYELPSNIVGLTFNNPIATAQSITPGLRANNDVVIALTHIGFTTNPKSVEVDSNVDTNLAAQVPGIDAIIGSHSHTNPASPETPFKYLPTIVGGPDGKQVLINQAYRYNNTLGEVVLGLRAKAGGGYEVVSRTGRYLSVPTTTAVDQPTAAILQPYVDAINLYNGKTVGQTTTPIDTINAFTQETNGANLQAEASVWELAKNGITDVDFHLSGAMTNKLMASSATEANPVTLKISDMFGGMPYENSLVVLKMNGPQLKAVLERAYRNYYYYKYVPGYGGYSYYTTCMIDINSIGRIYYKDSSPALPDGNNVVALVINGKPVDFADATKTYNVSTVNYLAAGSCNFNDNGVSLWPLNQIVHDTQYYVRDAVIDYITAMGTVSPKVEGRLLFGDTVKPVVTITAPLAQEYLQPDYLTLDFTAIDGEGGTIPGTAPVSGVKEIVARLDQTMIVTSGQKIDLHTLALGNHTLRLTASDYYGNATEQSVTFTVIATVQSMKTSVNRLYTEGAINDVSIRNSLLDKLTEAQTYLNKGNTKAAINTLNAFINSVKAQSGKHITKAFANLLIADATYVIAHPK